MSKRTLWKKIGAVIATTCLALAFAGCGGNAPKAADTGKKITIEYWHINNENFGLPTVRELIKSFEAENPNIKVSEKYFNGYMPLMQGVQAAMASGNPPAVAQSATTILIMPPRAFRMLPLTKLSLATKTTAPSYPPTTCPIFWSWASWITNNTVCRTLSATR